MAEWTERAELLFKEEGLMKLQKANVLIVGLGGVGSFAAEFITRAGIGKITIVDGDVVDITNINRQLPALHSTVGKPKIDIVGDRLMDINPELQLTKVQEFLSPERAFEIVSDLAKAFLPVDNYTRSYKSPTDMGINTAGFCIINDDIIKQASIEEIDRRISWYQEIINRGDGDKIWIQRCQKIKERL